MIQMWCVLLGLLMGGLATASPQRFVLEDWSGLIKEDLGIGKAFRETQVDWSQLSKSKEWKSVLGHNQQLARELLKLSNVAETGWMKSELQNEKKLNTLLTALQFDLLQARHAIAGQKHTEANRIWTTWLQVAQDVTNSEGGVVGLRLGVVIRSLVFDDLERELKNTKSKWSATQDLLLKMRSSQALWPVDKIVKNTLAEFQVQVASEAAKKTPLDFVEKFYGKVGPRMAELIREHKSAFSLDEVLADTSHYTQYMVDLFSSNPYSPSSEAIEKVQKEMLVRLKGELADASFVLENLSTLDWGQKQGTRKLSELEAMDKSDFKKLRKKFFAVENPLGRLLVTEYLFHLGQIWRDFDVSSMKTELSRESWIQGMLAIRAYRAEYKRNPKSMEDLVSHQLLSKVPMNYNVGRPLNYSAKVGSLDLVTVQ